MTLSYNDFAGKWCIINKIFHVALIFEEEEREKAQIDCDYSNGK